MQNLPAAARTIASRPVVLGAIGLLLSLTQTGCLVIGGRSSRGGFFFIPGGIVGLLLVVIVLSSLRRR